MLNCWMKDCEDYLPPPLPDKENNAGVCRRIEIGYPISIGSKTLTVYNDLKQVSKINVPACMFYRGSASARNEK